MTSHNRRFTLWDNGFACLMGWSTKGAKNHEEKNNIENSKLQVLTQFKKIGQDALTELKKVTDLAGLEDFRIKYLARKGQITQLLSQIGKLPAEQKPQAGQLANKIKKEVTKAY